MVVPFLQKWRGFQYVHLEPKYLFKMEKDETLNLL